MMKGRRLPAFLVICTALIALAIGIQLATSPVAAQHGMNVKITGKVTNKLIAHFGPSGLSGVRTIEYRRLVMAPGARMEGQMVMEDHAEFCIVEKGSVTITTADGAKRTYKAGDVFIKPKGLAQTLVAADPREGYVELYWIINLKGPH